jgi:uncharacterized protein YktB (UPF0637 family)
MAVTRGISKVGKENGHSLRDDASVKNGYDARMALLTLHYMGALTGLWVDWLDSDKRYGLPKSILSELKGAERVRTVTIDIPSQDGSQSPVPVEAWVLTSKNKKALNWLLRSDNPKVVEHVKKARENITGIMNGQIAEIANRLLNANAEGDTDGAIKWAQDEERIDANDIAVMLLINGSGRHQGTITMDAKRAIGISEEKTLCSLAKLLDYMFIDVGSSLLMSLAMKNTSQLFFYTTQHGKELLNGLAHLWMAQGGKRNNALSKVGIAISGEDKLFMDGDSGSSHIRPTGGRCAPLQTF